MAKLLKHPPCQKIIKWSRELRTCSPSTLFYIYIYIFFFHIVISILEMFPQGRKKSHELVRDEIQEIKQIESSQAVSIQFQKLEILACHLARSCPPLYDRVTLSRSRKQFRRWPCRSAFHQPCRKFALENAWFVEHGFSLLLAELASLLIKILFSKI